MYKILALSLALAASALAGPKVTIVIGEKAHAIEQLAAKQIARDMTALFEAETTIQTSLSAEGSAAILLGSTRSNPAIPDEVWPPSGLGGIVIKSTPRGLVVLASIPGETLWAASELSYRFGMRHLLQGDVLPIQKAPLKLEGFDVRLESRAWLVWDGFNGLPYGLDSWSAEDAERFVGQLVRLKFSAIILPEKLAPFAPLAVDGDSAGRIAFKGAKVFANPEVATVLERLKARATELGINVVSRELASLTPATLRGTPENSVLPHFSVQKLGIAGTVVVRGTPPGDLNAVAHFLSRAAFEEGVTPERALADLVTPICGEGVAERLWMGFGHVAKASELIAAHDPKVGVPDPKMFLRHLESKEPLPAWITEVKTLYASAMNEMYRGNTRARGGARPFILYHAKRMEFALHYFTALEALYKAHDPATRAESLEAAVESVYNALNAYADVARDASDRGVIAVLNEAGYRVLLKAADGEAK